MNNVQPSSADQKAALIAEAAAQMARSEAEANAASTQPKRRRRITIIALWVLLVGNVLAWLVFPPTTAAGTDARSAAEVERNVRLVLAAAAADVENWRTGHGGRLPATIGEVNSAHSDLAYAIVDSATFELHLTDGAVSLSYRSTTPVADFLAASSAGRP